MKYNRLNALYYQLTEFVERLKPGFINQAWVKKVREYCRPDWAEWKTHLVLLELEDQVEDLHALWDLEEQDLDQPIYSEKASDGSEAQELLGGELRVTSTWLSEHDSSS